MSRKSSIKKQEEVKQEQILEKKNYLQKDLITFLVVSCIIVAGIIGIMYYNQQTGKLDTYVEKMEIDFLK